MPISAINEINYWIKADNIYRELIKEPAEVMIVIFARTGLKLIVTNNEDYRVNFPFEFLEKEKLKIKDIDIVIHSHSGLPVPSEADLKLYHYLWNRGFKGKFGIISRMSKQILWIEIRSKK